jgi:hypothetical protein
MGNHKKKKKIAMVLVLLLLIFTALPSAVYAQGPNDPHDAIPDEPTWETIPDIAGYLSFVVPQCGDCNGQTAIMDPYEDAQFPELSWDIRAVFGGLIRWLLSGVSNLFRWLVCWLLQMLQHLANFLALMVNGLIFIGNFIVRLGVFIWLNVRSWLYAHWWLFEHTREFWQDVRRVLFVIFFFINEIIRLNIAALILAGRILVMILSMYLIILKILAWIGALTFGTIIEVLGTLKGTSVPIQITGTHPAYSIVRGSLDAIFDSQIGWLMWLNIAMAYIAWVTWLAKFFGGDKA